MPNSFKRVLIFTNNPISLNNSNGRSIYNLFSSFDNFEIYNLYVHSGSSLLENIQYFRVTDIDVIDSFFRRKQLTFRKNIEASQNQSHKRKIRNLKKSPFKMLVRDFLWSKQRVTNQIVDFVKQLNPNILVYQVGDFPSFNKIAVDLKRQLDIPLIVYDTEDYFFKNWDYISGHFYKGLVFKRYKKKYDFSFERLISHTDYAIFLTEDLKEIHSSRFKNLACSYIYNSFSALPEINRQRKGIITYSGNLEVGRADSLLDVSEVLYRIDPDFKIIVCSQTKDKNILKKIKSVKNIEFKGEVSFEDNLTLLSTSDLILHFESFDRFYAQDTKHAFSTKIPDCLFTLTPLLIYAPANCSLYRYFDKYQCGWISKDQNDLEKCLNEIIGSSFQNKYIDGALRAIQCNHDPHKNSLKMLRIVEGLI